MDFGTDIAFTVLSLPARMIYNIWRGPQGRLMAQDDVMINIECAVWMMSTSVNKSPVMNIMQILHLILFILISHRSLRMLKNRSKNYVIALVMLSSVYTLARLALTFHDPADFGGTICATGTTFIFLMKVLCEPQSLLSEISLFGNGVIWSIGGLIKPDIFILVPNLVGGLLGLVLLVLRYRS